MCVFERENMRSTSGIRPEMLSHVEDSKHKLFREGQEGDSVVMWILFKEHNTLGDL